MEKVGASLPQRLEAFYVGRKQESSSFYTLVHRVKEGFLLSMETPQAALEISTVGSKDVELFFLSAFQLWVHCWAFWFGFQRKKMEVRKRKEERR